MYGHWLMEALTGPSPACDRPSRGRSTAAENSISAFKTAAAAGVDAIETDVRLTRDGVPVCVHDPDLSRLCGDPRAVSDLDLATLRSLLPSIVTLGDALGASDPLGILLDIKLSHEGQIAQIISDVAQCDAMRRALIGLRSIALIDTTRRLSKDVAILAFLEDPACADAARAVGADWFRLWQRRLLQLCLTPFVRRECALLSWLGNLVRSHCRNIRPFPWARSISRASSASLPSNRTPSCLTIHE